MAAGTSGKQEDVIAAANMGRKAIADLLKACKVRDLISPKIIATSIDCSCVANTTKNTMNHISGSNASDG